MKKRKTIVNWEGTHITKRPKHPDKIVYVGNGLDLPDLTYGKIYNTLPTSGGYITTFYYIINDLSFTRHYNQFYFLTLSEFREAQIDLILK